VPGFYYFLIPELIQMKKLGDYLFSSYLMATILAIFAISIGAATFIENDFGSESAKALVYHAPWFLFLLFIGVINLTGNIFRKKLYTKPKLTLFVFHMAFILILAGAAITHYTGFEGTLSMNEGETSSQVLTSNAFIQVKAGDQVHVFPARFSAVGKNKFRNKFKYNGQEFKLTCQSFTANAIPELIPDDKGKPMADLVYTDSTGRTSIIIAEGEKKLAGPVTFSFNRSDEDSTAVKLYMQGDSLVCSAPFAVIRTGMSDQVQTILPRAVPFRLMPLQLYTFSHTMVVMRNFLGKAAIKPRPVAKTEGGANYDALALQISAGGEFADITVWGKAGYIGNSHTVSLKNNDFDISYGSVYENLPFSLKLNDFIVERYPGSKSPSWFESRVELKDDSRQRLENRRIFMNNILNYRGYRFYQSSYTSDEKGTILSVNRDWAGTWVTYAGYLLMALGMISSLINRNSRFRALSVDNVLLKEAKKGLAVILFLFTVNGLSAQDGVQSSPSRTISLEHAKVFGRLLLQDNSGRIEPVSTLSSDVLRKLYRKDKYNGLTAEQVFIGMMANPESWQHEPIIRTTHPQIQEIMGSKGKYFSFASFFPNNNYILHSYVENAFRKKPAERNKFDNEIIRLDERINICYLMFTGDLLRVLPVPGDSSHTWYSYRGIAGKVNSPDSVFLYNVIPLYVQDVNESMQSGNWKGPDDIVKAITNYQASLSARFLPSARKVSTEIFLNESNIFTRISNVYGIVGFVLLIIQFIGLFYTRLKLKIPVTAATIIIIIAFVFHAIGLGMRWYVSGHAPWSNGYEALTYIAWATVLAGLIFSSRSSIALSAGSVMAFLLLGTAHLSWMDPQITNLVPVLKSYWLVIHVATITASYAFLGLGALLAAFNLILMIMVTRKSFHFIDLTIRELSNVTEMTLIVGLYMITIGTFLGGVWANESWGRYWGWDPKETWALVTVLVYAFISHMRMVPGLRGLFAFNLASLLGFSSVIMTYFGVNFYLSGLHSYAKGDPLPIPSFVYYTVVIVFVLALTAFINYRKMNREMNILNVPVV
jgi:cytochrome c-type biogenesis protein CcsB